MRASIRSGVPASRSRSGLLPDQDVAPLDAERRVVKIDPARKVHAKRDQLIAASSRHRRPPAARRGPTSCTKRNSCSSRSRRYRDHESGASRGSCGDVAHLEAHMHESPAMAPERADFANRHSRPLVQAAEGLPIEPRFRIDAQCRTAKGHERRNRRVDIDNRRAVQRQLDSLVVFVLLDQAELADMPATSARQHQRRAEAARKP